MRMKFAVTRVLALTVDHEVETFPEEVHNAACFGQKPFFVSDTGREQLIKRWLHLI
jgi:hypothetical protein